jgi:hypothetical protein
MAHLLRSIVEQVSEREGSAPTTVVLTRRSAASPVRISPSSRSTTTDGICGAVVPRVQTSTTSPRPTAAAE